MVWRDSRGWIIPPRYIRRGEVTEVSHPRGAMDGLGIGFAVGGSLGLLAGTIIGGGDQEFALRATVGLGSIFGVIGLIIGAAEGADFVHEVDVSGGIAPSREGRR